MKNILCQVEKLKLNFENVQLEDLYQDPAILSYFKYAPITLVHVERSFSVFKNMLTDKWHSFTEEKLEMHNMIIHFNNKYNFKNKLSSENSLNFFFYKVFK